MIFLKKQTSKISLMLKVITYFDKFDTQELSFHGEVDIYSNARSVFSTVSSLQDSRRCRFKKETARNYFNFLN